MRTTAATAAAALFGTHTHMHTCKVCKLRCAIHTMKAPHFAPTCDDKRCSDVCVNVFSFHLSECVPACIHMPHMHMQICTYINKQAVTHDSIGIIIIITHRFVRTAFRSDRMTHMCSEASMRIGFFFLVQIDAPEFLICYLP